MASISPVSSIALAPTQLTLLAATQAVQGTGLGPAAAADNGSASGDTTIYVTNADGTVSVTTTNAQGEIVAISTIPAPVIAAAAGATSGSGVSARAPGALLNLVA